MVFLVTLACSSICFGVTRSSTPIVMRLLPEVMRAEVGDSITLRLEFTNVSRQPVRIWMAPFDRLPGWDLKVTMSTWPWGKRVLIPNVRRSLIYEPANSDVVLLRPGRSVYRRVELVRIDGDRMRDSDLQCLDPDEYRSMRRIGTWSPHLSIVECLNRPGTYTLEAELDLSRGFDTALAPDPAGGPPLFTGQLHAKPVRLKLTPEGR
jgi:hypothetical protein